jgi:hypothetical protein
VDNKTEKIVPKKMISPRQGEGVIKKEKRRRE